MKKLLLKLLLVLCTSSLFSQSLSPDVISTAGEFFVGSNAMLSWTIGETIITTLEGTSAILTQGFQQPFEMVVIPDDVSDLFSNLQIKVFPNPTSNFLNVSFLIEQEMEFVIDVVDMGGRVLFNDTVLSSQLIKQIDFSLFKPGTYILRLRMEDGQLMRSYKVQKIVQ